MNRFARLGLIAVALGTVLAFGTVGGFAQDKAQAVKDRQTTMKRQGADLKYVSDYLKGVNSDQAGAIEKTNDLLSIAPKIPDLFVPGTSAADFPDVSHAKPEIWQEWDKFKAIPVTLQANEEKLAAALKSGDKGAIGAAMGGVGKDGCGACHTSYREKLPQ